MYQPDALAGPERPGFEGFGPAYRDALQERLRVLVAEAGGSDAAVDQRRT